MPRNPTYTVEARHIGVRYQTRQYMYV